LQLNRKNIGGMVFSLQIFCMGVLSSLVLILCFSANPAYALEFTPEFMSKIEKQYGEYAKRRVVAWQKLIQEHQNKSEREKLEAVNNFFNLFEYRSDLAHWGQEDYWATPLEFVVSGAGDCEEYAIAKYFTLRELGVPDEKLLLEYVKLEANPMGMSEAHMVLLYYETPDGIPLVLDNYNKEIVPGDKRPDLTPIYGFNGSGLWQAKELGKGNKIGKASDLKNWSSLEQRMQAGEIAKWNE